MVTYLPKLMIDEEKTAFEELIYFNFAEEINQSGLGTSSIQNNRETETLDTIANQQ